MPRHVLGATFVEVDGRRQVPAPRLQRQVEVQPRERPRLLRGQRGRRPGPRQVIVNYLMS